MRERPIVWLASTVAAAVVFFVVSASGHQGSFWENGPVWLGDIGWFAFLAMLLLLVVEVVVVGVTVLRRRRGSAGVA
jgi:uncharacterized membrane protein